MSGSGSGGMSGSEAQAEGAVRAGPRAVTWDSTDPPPRPKIGAAGWLRIALRGAAIVLAILLLLPILLALRGAERLVPALSRRLGDGIAHLFFRIVLRVIGIEMRHSGRPMQGAGVLAANHSSWLDIVALNAAMPLVFVAKSEVAGWPGIGFMARAAGTLFVRRDRAAAQAQVAQLRDRLKAGEKLVLFPEGTSTDGQRVLPFKATLFAALCDDRMREDGLEVQPVSVIWTAPPGQDPRFYGWWGGMDLGPHLLAVLAAPRQGQVRLVFHPPIPLAPGTDRKSLARAAEVSVRSGTERFQDMAAR